MEITEKELEDLIFNTNNENLQERGLEIYGKKKRQLIIGNYGKLDLMTSYRGEEGCCKNDPLIITIMELKKNAIGVNTLNQIIRYAQGIKDYMAIRNFNNYMIKLTLIGSAIELNNELFTYLPNLIQPSMKSLTNIFSIDYYVYKIDWDGIYFEKHKGYSLINKGF